MLLLGGATVARSFRARAQPKKVPVVGVLLGVNMFWAAYFEDGVGDSGFVPGKTVVFDYSIAQQQYDLLPKMAADFVRRRVDAIAAFGTEEARAAKHATATIPIVFASGDPIAEGLVASLGRPGGNLTGVSLMDAELMPKRLEFLSELVPRATSFGLLVNPKAANVGDVIQSTSEAARAKKVKLHVLKAFTYDEIDAAFQTFDGLRVGGLVFDFDRSFAERKGFLISLAASHALPAIYGADQFAWFGGLISYGPSLQTLRHQVGVYVGRILKGEKPEDLPIMEPDKFELAVNLKTAKALGITVPPLILAQADNVIE